MTEDVPIPQHPLEKTDANANLSLPNKQKGLKKKKKKRTDAGPEEKRTKRDLTEDTADVNEPQNKLEEESSSAAAISQNKVESDAGTICVFGASIRARA